MQRRRGVCAECGIAVNGEVWPALIRRGRVIAPEVSILAIDR